MKMNTRVRYGLRMVVTIAKHKAVINTTDLGKEMMVSPKYLRKLAGPLEKAGIIRSVQGIYGGYTLNRRPNQITLGSILEGLGEQMILTECLKKLCPLGDECLTRPIWENLEEKLQKYFLKLKLSEILKRQIPS